MGCGRLLNKANGYGFFWIETDEDIMARFWVILGHFCLHSYPIAEFTMSDGDFADCG